MNRFALATLNHQGEEVAALALEGGYLPLPRTTVKGLLDDWGTAFARLQSLAEGASAGDLVAREAAHLLTPVKFPNKLIAVGANYKDHLEEMGMSPQKWPTLPFFFKAPTTAMVGPGKTVILPKTTRQFDWEIELAVVVGRRLKDAGEAEALAGIAGYAVGLDLSCRDLIKVDTPLAVVLVRGKAQDTMSPVGPVLVPAAFVADPHRLGLRLSVNGVLKQNGNTADMLYSVPEQLGTISRYVTLEPGDVILTGSPAGSGASTGQFLKAGDRISAEIDQLGVLEVEVVGAAR